MLLKLSVLVATIVVTTCFQPLSLRQHALKIGTRPLIHAPFMTTENVHLPENIGLSKTKLSSTAAATLESPKKNPLKTFKKLFPLGAMLFCILFNYTILRDTKDVLVVTSAGAEIIPFLKTYVNLPAAVGFTYLYSMLSNKMSADKVFYVVMSSFVSFFGLFASVIYPNRALLHPHAAADFLTTLLPAFFVPLISIFRNWTYALFYMLSNLWGNVIVSLLFWGFANEISTVDEAKKYYPLFGMMANIALIFSGQYVKYVSALPAVAGGTADYWGRSLKLLMGAVVGGGALVMALYAYMQKFVLTDPECVDVKTQEKRKKSKTKLSYSESISFLSKSPYIRNLAILVIAYGMSINIVEVTWKSKLRLAFPDPNSYSAFMGNFSSATGIITFLMMFFGKFVLEKFGWGVASLVTPVTLLVTGAGFFSLSLFPKFFAPIAASLGTTPLLLAVFIGAAQNIMSKAAKYALFDPCKESAYIPLDNESRTKGKAAVEVVGGPLGKSGGSFLQQFLIGIFGSLGKCTPYLGVCLGGIIAAWIAAASQLNTLLIDLQKEKAKPATQPPAFEG